MASIDGTLPETGLHKGTNWWGAFVIGLAGTILVTGIAPYVVEGTGALGIILMGVMTIAGRRHLRRLALNPASSSRFAIGSATGRRTS